MPEQQYRHSLKFKIGIGLLVANVPVGVGGGLLAVAIGVAAGHKAAGAAIGLSIYMLSWGMFGLGIILAGSEGVDLVRRIWQNLVSRCRKDADTTSGR